MKKIIKVVIFFTWLMSLFFIPNVNGMDRREETVYLTHGSSDQFVISLEKGEDISWKFETFNNSFLATLTISLYSLEFVCTEKEKGSYTIDIDETNSYLFGIYNQDTIDGYVHYIIEDKELDISGYSLFLILGIIGIVIIVKVKKLH